MENTTEGHHLAIRCFADLVETGNQPPNPGHDHVPHENKMKTTHHGHIQIEDL